MGPDGAPRATSRGRRRRPLAVARSRDQFAPFRAITPTMAAAAAGEEEVAVAEDEAVNEHAVVQIGSLGPSSADRGVAEALSTRREMASVVRV